MSIELIKIGFWKEVRLRKDRDAALLSRDGGTRGTAAAVRYATHGVTNVTRKAFHRKFKLVTMGLVKHDRKLFLIMDWRAKYHSLSYTCTLALTN